MNIEYGIGARQQGTTSALTVDLHRLTHRMYIYMIWTVH